MKSAIDSPPGYTPSHRPLASFNRMLSSRSTNLELHVFRDLAHAAASAIMHRDIAMQYTNENIGYLYLSCI